MERSDTHHVVASPCWHARMTDYRRNFIAGGSFFFTVNLAERRLRLLTQHIDELCAECVLAWSPSEGHRKIRSPWEPPARSGASPAKVKPQ